MPITLKVEGLEGVTALMKAIDKIGKTTVAGIEFLGTNRMDNSGLTNAQVADHLVDHKNNTRNKEKKDYDFFTPDKDIANEAAEAFAKVADREMQKAANKIAKATARAAKDPRLAGQNAEKIAQRIANSIASAGFKKAGEVLRLWIVSNIEDGYLASGVKAKAVEKIYAEWRKKKYGIATDVVGEATGDLLVNLADNKAFKLIRNKSK